MGKTAPSPGIEYLFIVMVFTGIFRILTAHGYFISMIMHSLLSAGNPAFQGANRQAGVFLSKFVGSTQTPVKISGAAAIRWPFTPHDPPCTHNIQYRCAPVAALLICTKTRQATCQKRAHFSWFYLAEKPGRHHGREYPIHPARRSSVCALC